ncbi:unnamed protein product, partial [Ectocarpus fasciculatus]
MLMTQIDVNHDGEITYNELSQFLWPEHNGTREVGAVITIFHQAFVNSLFGGDNDRERVLASIDGDDLPLMKAFATKANVRLLRGNLIETRALKKAFSKLMCVSLGLLSHHEVDVLLESLDTNRDGVLSPREFKQWLLLPIPVSNETFLTSSTAGAEAARLRKE